MIQNLIIGLTMLSILGLVGCACEQTGHKKLASPDGRYAAIERETDCGATDPYGTAIYVQPRQPRLGITWLGFPNRRVFLADVALTDVQVRWLDGHDLEVICNDACCLKDGIAERVSAWRDVKIHFDVGKARKGQF